MYASGTTNYIWDLENRLSSVILPANGGTVSFAYDANGRPSQTNLGNGAYTTYGYDAAGHLLHLVNYSSGSINSRFDYTYDASGRRTAITTLNGPWNYGYDAGGQLTSVSLNGSTVQYSYDAAGNRVAMVSGGATTGYNVNNLDQYTSVGGTAYGYDADGNLTSSGSWTYSYDDENRLTAVSGPTGRWTYQYDALGNRVAQTNGTTTTQYLVDPTGMGSVVAAFGGSSSPVNHFAYGLGLVSSLPASGSAQFYQFDGSANTVALTGTGGAVLNTYFYLPFGEKGGTGSVPNPFTYAGQFGISDDGDGLYYMRARYYDPAIGRFISEDPLGFDAGDNFYRYVGNNPLNFIDPFGLSDLVVNRQNGTLTVIGSNGQVIAVYPAGNATTNPNGDPNTVGSNGPAPAGTFPVQPPVNTAGRPEYGPAFFPVGAVDDHGRPADIARSRGIGIHGGRRGPQSRTHGCIRVSDQTARDLVNINGEDPIRTVTIR